MYARLRCTLQKFKTLYNELIRKSKMNGNEGVKDLYKNETTNYLYLIEA